jgi:putative SOS response-associated peptidase YedK
MCGRYTLTSTDRPALSARFEVELGPEVEPMLGRFNAAPAQEILTVTEPAEAQRTATGARWGLVPAWAEDLKVGYRMINARSERVFESRAYGPLVRRPASRCLIPADGFFEWMPPAEGETRKRPGRFTGDGGVPFSLAGLATERDWKGGRLVSCTILTTDANEVVEPVHDRMPVLFADPTVEASWLRDELSEDEVLALCHPFDPIVAKTENSTVS